MAKRKPLGQALRRQRGLLATFSIIPRPEIVEAVALAGFDSIILDLEHGPYELPDLTASLLAARARDIYPVIRVRSNDAAAIGAALDFGAAGVLVPQIDSAEAARAAIAAARFAPQGTRGVNPWVRAFDYDGDAAALARANRDTAVMLLIEGRAGLDALPAIVGLPGLDCLFLGPVDMANALGLPGQPQHPTVVGHMESVIAAATARGIATAVFAATAEAATAWLRRGVGYVAVSIDTAVLGGAYRALHAGLDTGRP